MSQKIEIKRFETKLVAADATDTMEFSGYGAAFDNVDSYGDVIQKGAFSAYLDDVASGKQQWPAMLMQHGGWGMASDDFTPVGVYTDLKEDDFGLKTAGTLAPTPRGSEAYALMKMAPRPAISGLSIGFYVRDAERASKSDPFDRIIKKIDLVEISLVTFPANDKARIHAVKSVNDLTEREFEQILRDVGLTQKEAKTVIAYGFRRMIQDGDVESQELKMIENNILNLQRIISCQN